MGAGVIAVLALIEPPPFGNILGWSTVKSFAFFAKIPVLAKAGLGTLGLLFTFAAVNAPVGDPWFDSTVTIVGLVLFNAIIKGEPEPDLIRLIKEGKMSWPEFFYLWWYRSTHLASISATAYFIHPNKWGEISRSEETEGHDVRR